MTTTSVNPLTAGAVATGGGRGVRLSPVVVACSYLVGYALVGVSRYGNLTGVIPAAVTTAVAAGVLIAHRRVGLRETTLWGVVAIGFAYLTGISASVHGELLSHLDLGMGPLRYDRVVHLAAGVALVSVIGQLASRRGASRRGTTFSTAFVFGVAVEAAEIVLSWMIHGRPNIESADILLDCAFNALGFLIGVRRLAWSHPSACPRSPGHSLIRHRGSDSSIEGSPTPGTLRVPCEFRLRLSAVACRGHLR